MRAYETELRHNGTEDTVRQSQASMMDVLPLYMQETSTQKTKTKIRQKLLHVSNESGASTSFKSGATVLRAETKSNWNKIRKT